MNCLSQGSLDINTFYTCLKILWDELKNFQPVLVCQCGGMKACMNYQQQEYVMQFFIGLNESYFKMRGQILMFHPLPPIVKVFNLVVQEERQHTIGSGSPASSESLAFSTPSSSPSVAASSSQSKPKRNLLICSHYGLTKAYCGPLLQVTWVPTWYKPKPKAQLSSLQSTNIDNLDWSSFIVWYSFSKFWNMEFSFY